MRQYAEFESFQAFERVVDPSVFQAMPAESYIGVSDVVDSTAAINAGRYKSVNMAGAAVISAIMNAVGHRNFPFVFGGDGSSCLVGESELERARDAMARTARWVADDLDLEMRVALVPVAAVRAAGFDVRVARYAASSAASYAMFSGGGLHWAEAQAKAGAFAVPLASPGSRPDLTGLSCRWQPVQSRHGTMLSLIAQPSSGAAPGAFARLVTAALDLVKTAEERQGHPIPIEGPSYGWPPPGLELEARATRHKNSLVRQRLSLRLQTLLALVLFRTGWKVGDFAPTHYVQQTGINTDYRKFDDGLRMTIDCSAATVDRLEQLLREAEHHGTAHFGMHRQAEALMTCIVPSVMTDDHLHFIDGAGGGYAMAALHLKSKLKVSAAS
jgi:Protein of unknown function (DUF3095)